MITKKLKAWIDSEKTLMRRQPKIKVKKKRVNKDRCEKYWQKKLE